MCLLVVFFGGKGGTVLFLQQFVVGSGTGAYFFYHRGTNGAQAIVFKVVKRAPVFCFFAYYSVFYHEFDVARYHTLA